MVMGKGEGEDGQQNTIFWLIKVFEKVEAIS
jgi:hypothetical protein